MPSELPTLRTTPMDDVVTVGGAPESVLDLQQEGLIAPGVATVLDGEPGWHAPVDVVTDGDQRRERAFGANDEAVSTVLGAEDPWRIDRATHDYPTVPRDQEGAEDGGQVVATYDGLAGLTASSSQGYADNFGPVTPQAGPYAAIDGDRQTRWVTSSATDPREQWLRLDFDAPRGVHEVRVLPVVDDGQVLPIRSLEVVAGDQVRRVEASPSGAPSVVEFDGREVDRVEVRITSVGTRGDHGRIGLREVTVDGLTPTRSLVVPREVPEGGAFLFDTTGERRACMFTLGTPDCQTARIRSAEEPAGLSRTFSTAVDAEVGLRGLVVARSTREAARLLDALAVRRSGATSVYGNDPKVASRFAYDGELSTSWISADEDTDPTLLFTLARRQVLRGIIVRGGIDAPVSAVVRAGNQRPERAAGAGRAHRLQAAARPRALGHVRGGPRQPTGRGGRGRVHRSPARATVLRRHAHRCRSAGWGPTSRSTVGRSRPACAAPWPTS